MKIVMLLVTTEGLYFHITHLKPQPFCKKDFIPRITLIIMFNNLCNNKHLIVDDFKRWCFYKLLNSTLEILVGLIFVVLINIEVGWVCSSLLHYLGFDYVGLLPIIHCWGFDPLYYLSLPLKLFLGYNTARSCTRILANITTFPELTET